MIVPDVNVLVYAHREDATHHDRYADWLAGAAAGKEDVGLVEGVLIGFVRIVTHPRVFAEPATMAEALAFVTALRDGSTARLLVAAAATWEHFMDLAGTDRQVLV